MRPGLCLISLLVVLVIMHPIPGRAAHVSIPLNVQSLIRGYCLDCHNAEKRKGKLDLELILNGAPSSYLETWDDISWMLAEREMPPIDEPDVPRPDEASYDDAATALERWIDDAANLEDAGSSHPVISTKLALVEEYCVSCHGAEKQEGELALHEIASTHVPEHAEIWEAVVRKLRARQMPPVGRKRPNEKSYDAVMASLVEDLDAEAAQHPNPGRTATFRRLTRFEYQNSIRDLLGLEIDAAKLLPRDESSHGFDNITVGDLSPTLLERYISAAQRISRLALGTPRGAPDGTTVRIRADVTQEGHMEGLPLGTRGGILINHTFPEDGEYEIEMRLARDRNERVEGLDRPHTVEFLLDGALVADFEIDRPAEHAAHATADAHLRERINVSAGPHEVGVTFVADSFNLLETKRQPYEAHFNIFRHPRLSPAVYQVSITGPFGSDGPGSTPSRDMILVTTAEKAGGEDAAAEAILSRLLRRAYRRPLQDGDLDKPMAFFHEASEHGGFDAGIEMALGAILVSPEFLFRIERDPKDAIDGEPYRVTDIELASRLSFFLWSSIPDEELLAVAEQGELSSPDVLAVQVRRMLADERSNSLVKNFAAQWLYLRNLSAVAPDTRLFVDFDDNLRQAMRTETEMLVSSVIREDRSVLDLLKPRYTFLNERLAKHYNIPHVYGSRFRRIDLDEDWNRGGLLRQGSILTVTSYANRTSPVIRGNWILENIVGAPPPPPPPNVPVLEAAKVSASLPIRERLAVHRENPACASCHDIMDPIGFALENFDAVGRFRGFENGEPVDVVGGFPDGSEFEGFRGLEDVLMRRPELFAGTVTEKLLTFALGRGVEYYDAPSIRKIVRDAAADDYRLSSIILGVTQSVPFTMRSTP